MTRVMLPGQHAWLRAAQAHTHCSRDHSIRHDHLRVRHSTGVRYRGVRWGEKHRHLYWLLAASSLLKIVLKTLKYSDCSCTLHNDAAFYKQPKNLNILPALFFVALSFPTGWGPGQLEMATIPTQQPFSHLPVPPGAPVLPCHWQWGSGHSSIPQGMALRNWPLLRKSYLQILGHEKSPGTGLLPNKAESYMWAIKRHLFI